jgi:hypothetical protein
MSAINVVEVASTTAELRSAGRARAPVPTWELLAARVSFAFPGAINLVEVASTFVLLSFLAMSERPSRAEDVRRGR